MTSPTVVGAPAIVLATLNAKYIHASLGLRYLLANLDRHGGAGLRARTVLREFTIRREPSEIVTELLTSLGPAVPGSRQVVGLGVYIWNVAQTAEVLRLLKAARPEVAVVLGGPEVSHETQQQEIVRLADHVITGWGDVSFAKLCRALLDGSQPLMKVIPGEQPALEQIELPYGEYSDSDLAHRLLYVEASRGCPFKCEFCLSSLEKTAWGFELERVLGALERLYQRGARHFKFVDRTFNLKIDTSVRILQFFLDLLPRDDGEASAAPLFLHFEVIPDHLPERLRAMIAQFPPGVLQLEIGVQSFNVTVQQTISRRQDNAASEANLHWLRTHSHAHLHADLIFGLPGETLASFAAGFDRLLTIGPHEIQLGMLKRLRGSPIARHTIPHGMHYASEAPYTVWQTGVMDAQVLQRCTRFARYWDLLANSGRFPRTLALLLHGQPGVHSAFASFMAFCDWLWARTSQTCSFTPEALVDHLAVYLSGAGQLAAETVHTTLLADYLASGARSNPQALQGLLPRRAPQADKPKRALATRQDRHQTPHAV
ncbi:DUF4080 domain-containing protein [Rhodoferax sp.]|uniref:B12-binding domain-containing radical SAM protein n=1 Tax=Rhodoferax sp. TaxID=50421 RepID=UPI00274CEE04|nr:DUF4080 domain-containing protein [Rhodoferax sp.]